jgi:hypothetical protein
MKVLIHYGDRIEETEIDCSEAPQAIEIAKAEGLSDFLKRCQPAPSYCPPTLPIKKVQAFLSGYADGFPIYRFLSQEVL